MSLYKFSKLFSSQLTCSYLSIPHHDIFVLHPLFTLNSKLARYVLILIIFEISASHVLADVLGNRLVLELIEHLILEIGYKILILVVVHFAEIVILPTR